MNEAPGSSSAPPAQSVVAASAGARHAARNYAIVTAAYWGFTLTDGALRMLVLLHFYRLGYSPFTLAFLFLLYEAAGVLANLVGGWLATHYGIARMLAVGLVTQIVGFALLSALDPGWTAAMAVAWVVVAQGICGVAKDLTKTASKSAIKITQSQVQTEAKEQARGGSQGQLFKWVAWFTGSKNAMKGIGFFLGGVLLETLGFRGALCAMAGLLALVLVGVVASLPMLAGFMGASPHDPSPYSPASRLFWNEFYIDMAAVPELAASPEARATVVSTTPEERVSFFFSAPPAAIDFAIAGAGAERGASLS